MMADSEGKHFGNVMGIFRNDGTLADMNAFSNARERSKQPATAILTWTPNSHKINSNDHIQMVIRLIN